MNRVLHPRAFAVALVAFCAFFLNVSVSHATWNVIFTQPNGKPFTCCFFFNESVGFIAGAFSDGVYKTTNGGQTWINTPLPIPPPNPLDAENTVGNITQIRMTNPLHGWLTCNPSRPSASAPVYPGLYQTTNGGASWVPVNINEEFTDVYETSHALILCSWDLDQGASGYVSTDSGATFSPALHLSNGVDFVDDLHGVASGFHQQVWSHTTDGGITWTNLSPADTIETWSVYAIKGSSWFFTAGERDWDTPFIIPIAPTTIQYSSDSGATLVTGTKLPFRTTGHITGFGFTLYIQDYFKPQVFNGVSVPSSGLWRSKDSGKTWVSIGGPNTDEDRRFFVTGCRGEVIYAFDNNGNVYKSTDGGDGSLPQFTLPLSPLTVDSINVCSPRDTVISITDLGCDTILITNASTPAVPALDILDPKTGQPPVYPIIIADSGGTANLKLELHSSTVGAYQTKVFLEIERDGFLTYDTVTVQSALRFYNPVHLLAAAHYDSTSLCGSADDTLSLANDSCFAVQIVNAGLKYGTSFILDSNFNNDSIPAFSPKLFPIRFAPTKAGSLVDSLVLNLVVLGKAVRVSYPVTGVGKSDNPTLVMADRFGNPLPNEINFDTITRCNDSIFAFTISEQGCDSLFVSIAWLDSTKTKRPPFSQFHWYAPPPKFFTSGAVDTSGIEALPTVLGSYEGYLEITDSILGKTATVVSLIPYKVFVKPGTRILSLEDSVYNYDTIAFCDQKDSIIPIANLGCDTIYDSAVSISGSMILLIDTSPNMPFVINPNDTFFLPVRYLPLHSGVSTDTLTIVTNADSAPVRQIVLLGYATPTDTITFSAITSAATVVPGDTVSLVVMPGSKFKNKGLDAVKITLAYNGDIMVPYNTSNASTGMTGAATPFVAPPIVTGSKIQYLPITINGTDMTFDSTTPILNMQFLIMLSDSLSTDFHIASFVLNNGDNTFNKCLLGATIDTGTIGLQFVCGDTEIYNVLRYGTNWSPDDGIVPISEAVVYPNPVLEGSAITVPFTALRAVAVKIEIMDETGSVVYSNLNNVPQAGAAIYTIPGTAIRSGAYHYRLHPVDGGSAIVTGSFVVIR